MTAAVEAAGMAAPDDYVCVDCAYTYADAARWMALGLRRQLQTRMVEQSSGAYPVCPACTKEFLWCDEPHTTKDGKQRAVGILWPDRAGEPRIARFCSVACMNVASGVLAAGGEYGKEADEEPADKEGR
jgi:hypothetical protein